MANAPNKNVSKDYISNVHALNDPAVNYHSSSDNAPTFACKCSMSLLWFNECYIIKR